MVTWAQSLVAAGQLVWQIPDKSIRKRPRRIKASTLIPWGESDRSAPPV